MKARFMRVVKATLVKSGTVEANDDADMDSFFWLHLPTVAHVPISPF
jgi:hypothetical protein